MPKIEIDKNTGIAVDRALSGASFILALYALNYAQTAQNPVAAITFIFAICSMAIAFVLWRRY